MPDNDYRPATPFLFIPKDSSARPGSETDPNSVGWITGPAIFLISDQRRFESTPRYGVDYRILALVGNAGAVPAQQAFVEFALGLELFNDGVPPHFADELADTDRFLIRLGVAALSIPQSTGNHNLSWALSPKTFNVANTHQLLHAIPSGVVKIGDLLHDPAPKGYKSRTDRHTALRRFTVNLGGIWEGEEVGDEGRIIGPVKIEVTQEWNTRPVEQGATIPTYTTILHNLTTLQDRQPSLGSSYVQLLMNNYMHLPLDVDRGNQTRWHAVLKAGHDDTMDMTIVKSFISRKPVFTKLVLRRTRGSSAPPDVNENLLRRVRLDRSSTWPASRLNDFDIVREAIQNV